MPDYTWVGIYLLDGNELVLGPFVGKPSPHTRIPLGRGICGAAATEKPTIIVDDVNADPRYLACSIETQSEIVVPIMHGGEVLGEIDIDSDRPAAFGRRRPDAARGRRRAARASSRPALLERAVPADMAHAITLIPGDGIGPEVTAAVVRILDAAGSRHRVGAARRRASSRSSASASRCRSQLLDSIKRNKVALKGPVTTPIAEGFTSVNVGLRKALDLYANLRPVRNLPGVPSRFTDVDLVIVRENTEDLYAGLEHEVVPGVVESLKIITEKASTRIARVRLRARARERAASG